MNGISNPFSSIFKSEIGNHKWSRMVQELLDGKKIPFETQAQLFQQISSVYDDTKGPYPVWNPHETVLEHSNIGRLMAELELNNYKDFHTWSVRHKNKFWQKVLELLNIQFQRKPDQILDTNQGVENPTWLPGARFNCVDSCFTADPNKPAIVFGSEESDQIQSISYGELEELVNRIANGLKEKGFLPGDRIALYMPMTVYCVAAYLAIVKAGCTVVSIADSFSTDEVKKRIAISQTQAIITVVDYQRAGKRIQVYEKIKGLLPAIVIGTSSVQELEPNDTPWESLLSKNSYFKSHVQSSTDYTNILFSSGTTGTPKAIPWNHLTPLKCAMDGYFHQDIHPSDTVMWPTNIGWMMGPWLIYATLINKATIALYEGAPYGTEFMQFVKQSKLNILGLVPSLVRTWRNSQLLFPGDWSQIRLFSSTGEPSHCEDYLWLMSLSNYQSPVIEYLGGTEIGGGHITGSIVQPASPSTFTTPALGIDFVILNENRKEVQEGEIGELFLIPPALGLSQELLNKDHSEIYYKNCPKGPHDEILRRHGDHIAKLPGCFFQAKGRTDDTMNLGGIKVSSVELEDVINQHEAVYESAAISVLAERDTTKRLMVFAKLKFTYPEEELINELNHLISKQLNPLFQIHKVVILEKLPRTASNKLMRRTLRDNYLRIQNGDQ